MSTSQQDSKITHKIGFWAVISIVIGSQIGSGVFMLPSNLAPYGGLSVMGWVISGCGAMCLGLVFAMLCSRYPQTGGPHIYVDHAFGKTAALFTGWTYWVISWVTTPVVVVTCIGYLFPFIGDQGKMMNLAMELLLMLGVTLLNLRGVSAAGHAEFFLTLLKFIPLVVIPVAGLYYFDSANLVKSAEVMAKPISSQLAQVTLLTLWGFIGLETATAPAGSVENASKVIPRAIVIGTFCVVLVYLLNSIGIMGLISGPELATAKAPYVDATQRIFGGQWHYAISLIAFIICLGTLNAWVLTSGQIILGLAQDRLVPSFLAQKNSFDAPSRGLIISSLGVGAMLIFTADESLTKQVNQIIDISVVSFLFIYLISSLSLLKLSSGRLSQRVIALVSTGFCLWIITQTPVHTLFIASLFTMSGVPVYLWYRLQKSTS